MSLAIAHRGAHSDEDRRSRPLELIAAGVELGIDRVPAGPRGRRVHARPDEDAVTLASAAAAQALGSTTEVAAILFACTSPPYEQGGSVQTLAELMGLQGSTLAIELGVSLRDGLTAVRLASALADERPVLVCAAHLAGEDRTSGDGAVALLVGTPGSGEGSNPLARLTPAASLTVEVRDRWRLAGEAMAHTADDSFLAAIATRRLVDELLAAVPLSLRAQPAVVGPDRRASQSVERDSGGEGDPFVSATGTIGTAHPLLRLLGGLGEDRVVAAVSNGLGEALHVEAGESGGAYAEQLAARLAAASHDAEAPLAVAPAPDYAPFASVPRSWRDRGRDLRLEGLIAAGDGAAEVPSRTSQLGTTIACTNDHVFPGAASTEMAVVDLDTGGRFYGQVAIGEHVAIGDRVELVLRRLHHGGAIVHYFWKVRPCR